MKELKTFYYTSLVDKEDYSTRNVFVKIVDDSDEKHDKYEYENYEQFIDEINLTYDGRQQWKKDIKEQLPELEYTDEVHPDTRTFVLDRLPVGRGMTDRHLLYMITGLLKDNMEDLPNVIHSIRVSPPMIDSDNYAMHCKVLVRGHNSRNDEELEEFLKSNSVDKVDSYSELKAYFMGKEFDTIGDAEEPNVGTHYFIGDVDSIDGWLDKMNFDENRTQYGFYLDAFKNEKGGVNISLEKYIITKTNDKYYIQG